MYIEGKNKWSSSAKQDGKCRELEVVEIDNGFICRVNDYTEPTDGSYEKRDAKEKIVFSKTNPLEGQAKKEDKDAVLDVSSMFEGMAKSMGQFLVK